MGPDPAFHPDRAEHDQYTAFPDAIVMGWEPLEDAYVLPDPDDRHVLAAAVKGRADVTVTDNLKDFPARSLPADLEAQSADEFLLDALDLQPAIVNAAAGVVPTVGQLVSPAGHRTVRRRSHRSSRLQAAAPELANYGIQGRCRGRTDRFLEPYDACLTAVGRLSDKRHTVFETDTATPTPTPTPDVPGLSRPLATSAERFAQRVDVPATQSGRVVVAG